ncbi:hypothetical protein [Fontivita pretiosa]|uniref:hypothetical protein n=1 Tax=Fontivita pretiosa TaxID=2989684 RepID=UPI003D1790B9
MIDPEAAADPIASTTAPHAADLYCPGCGYNLRGIDASQRCPECGLSIDRSTLGKSVIPWTARRHIGRARALFKTAWLASTDPRMLAREMAIAVSFRDAQRFRWTVVAIASVPLIAAAIIARATLGPFGPLFFGPWAAIGYTSGPQSPWPDVGICLFTGLFLWPVTPVAILLFITAISGVQSYFFHPRSLPVVRQNRAVALSCYSSGPLLFLTVPSLVFSAAALLTYLEYIGHWIVKQWLPFFTTPLMWLAGTILALAVIFTWWLNTVRMLRDATHCGPGRTLVAAIGLPSAWVLLALVTLGLIPIMCGFVVLVWESYMG